MLQMNQQQSGPGPLTAVEEYRAMGRRAHSAWTKEQGKRRPDQSGGEQGGEQVLSGDCDEDTPGVHRLISSDFLEVGRGPAGAVRRSSLLPHPG
jgi:hypothetical protein